MLAEPGLEKPSAEPVYPPSHHQPLYLPLAAVQHDTAAVTAASGGIIQPAAAMAAAVHKAAADTVAPLSAADSILTEKLGLLESQLVCQVEWLSWCVR